VHPFPTPTSPSRLRHAALAAITMLSATTAHNAHAQSNVTVTGLMDVYAGSMKYSGDTHAVTSVNSGGMTTSWVGFKGSEDLGGGLQASFALTSFLRADTGASGRFPGNETMWSRDANVGLSGGFGRISVGRDLAPEFLPTILFNPFGDSFTFSPLILHMNVPLFNASGWASSLTGDTGWSNEVIYTTPEFGGLKANLHYQAGEVAGNAGKGNAGANLLYFSGPLALTAFAHSVRVNNPLNTPADNVQPGGAIPLPWGLQATRQNAWMLGGTYDFNVVKAFATYGRTSHDIDLKDKTLSLGASLPIGHGKILADWAQTQRSGAAVGDELKRQTFSLGYDHNLSKRTDLYAVLMHDKITDQKAGTSFGLGIRHSF
jgi:predicted porin